MTLHRDGVTWIRIVYVCDRLPAGATTEERDAYAKGWRFSPSLLFRNGVVVPEEQFDQQTPAPDRTAVQVPELTFHEGGEFP